MECVQQAESCQSLNQSEQRKGSIMTQKAIVKKIIDSDTAEIIVQRTSACGGDCEKCGGCGAGQNDKISALAVNKIGANIGDSVIIEGDTKAVLGTAALVYVLPIVLFFVFYAALSAISVSPAVVPVFACLGFCAGIGCAIWYNNKLKKENSIVYTIIKK